ncbi:MAG: peptide synthase, partial [candidate division NC10 bacterium]
TEVLPVSSIDSREILATTRRLSESGSGTCVGRPMEGVQIAIIAITDEPLPYLSQAVELGRREIGEIIVKGPVVTKQYFQRPAATRLSKIIDERDNAIWHRMGDVGYLDERGRLWFCGRKAHRVQTAQATLFTIPCEAIFNRHPRVRRSALVGVGAAGDKRPVMIIELKAGGGGHDRGSLTAELLALGRGSPLTESIQTILYHPGFPVDIRHNAKISREKLAVWAERALK